MRFRNLFFIRFNRLMIPALFALTSCTAPVSCLKPSVDRVTVMTWNAQTFFDAHDDGGEFDEFKKANGGWTAEKYETRLDRLCEVILLCGKRTGMGAKSGPDLVVLEEIENARVVEDLCNRLPQRRTYRYAVFVPPDAGSAFGSAILSRFPVTGVTSHSVHGGEISLRPLVEATVQVGKETCTVFAAHWKSKLGDSGEEQTARVRSSQEALLFSRIAEAEKRNGGKSPLWVACGDFNQRFEEFGLMRAAYNCWTGWLKKCETGEVAGPAGSYCYRGNWETIDNIFVSDANAEGSGWAVTDFAVVSGSPVAGEDLTPNRYEMYSGKGYSDHLPLVMVLGRTSRDPGFHRGTEHN